MDIHPGNGVWIDFLHANQQYHYKQKCLFLVINCVVYGRLIINLNIAHGTYIHVYDKLHNVSYITGLLFISVCMETYANIIQQKYMHSIKIISICQAWHLWKLFGLPKGCVCYVHQTCEIYQVLQYSVDFQAPWVWYPLSRTVLYI